MKVVRFKPVKRQKPGAAIGIFGGKLRVVIYKACTEARAVPLERAPAASFVSHPERGGACLLLQGTRRGARHLLDMEASKATPR